MQEMIRVAVDAMGRLTAAAPSMIKGAMDGAALREDFRYSRGRKSRFGEKLKAILPGRADRVGDERTRGH